jgi:hypothetical protein
VLGYFNRMLRDHVIRHSVVPCPSRGISSKASYTSSLVRPCGPPYPRRIRLSNLGNFYTSPSTHHLLIKAFHPSTIKLKVTEACTEISLRIQKTEIRPEDLVHLKIQHIRVAVKKYLVILIKRIQVILQFGVFNRIYVIHLKSNIM